MYTNLPVIIGNYNSGCNTCGQSIILLPGAGGCGCQHPVIPFGETKNSPCADCDNPCDDLIETDCSLLSSADIPVLGIKHGDSLTKVIIIMAAEIIFLKQKLAILSP